MPEPLETEDFYDLRRPVDVAVSPDGDRAALVVHEFDAEADERRSSLFVVPTDGSRPPHRLSRASDASAPKWSPDGSKLGFLAARETDAEIDVSRPPADAENAGEDGDAGGDEDEGESDENDANGANGPDDDPKSQVWTFDLELGGDASQVTEFEEGASDFDWGPDGERVVAAARDPTDDQREYLESRREDDGPVVTERLQHKYDGQGYLDDVTTYLFVVDCETREAERLDDAHADRGAWLPAYGMQPRWSPDGYRIAFLSNRTERPDDNYVLDVYTVAPDGSDCRKLTDSTLTASGVRWHPEGGRLAFAAKDAENRYRPAEVYANRNSELTDYESRSGDLDRTVAGFGALAWDGDDVLAPVGDEGLTRLVRFHEDGNPERVFEAQGRDRTVVGFDAAGGTAVALLSDPREGVDAYAVAVDALGGEESEDGENHSEPTRLTELNADLLADRALPECRRITYESDGEEIEALAYLPPEFDPDEDDPRPLVASIHGGPVAYDAPEFKFEYAYFAGQGYVVLRPNYRGSSSYGRTFSEQIRGEWGPRETADVLAGVEELVDRGWADGDRCYATGFSYGGITTGYLVAETDRFAAAAAEHGVYDFRSAYGTDDCHVWWDNDYGVPWENPEAYDASSSITDVGDVETPLLVTAGGEDWRCPPSQSEQLYVSVKKRGVPARLVVYPDEHHAIGDPDRAIHRLEQLSEWFERYD
ncbi:MULTISPECIES: S9 family peptidase [Halorussus]|uniref:S9 family peptidase n=1 Tax=Halorussus TaxID=1070314 RepID=UPI00209CDFE0|nr:S9 family peptidase [Halorussus vallis]USZ77848.1 S9 family peptidase [Halorussus vallis]